MIGGMAKFIIWILVALAVSSCATETVVYDPKGDPARVAPQMSLSDAKRVAEAALKKEKYVQLGQSIITNFKITSTQLSYRYEFPTDPSKTPIDCVYTFGSSGGLSVVDYYEISFHVTLENGCVSAWDDQETAARFVDATLAVEKYYTTDHTAEIQADLVNFKPVADKYRAQKPRPGISEEARKFQVQAENAFDEKRYDDAIHFYGKALEIAPWWPDGHYNLALVLGHEEEFAEADAEMKKYLALVPDASDARKAKDQVYVWEGKLELMPHHAAPVTPAKQN